MEKSQAILPDLSNLQPPKEPTPCTLPPEVYVTERAAGNFYFILDPLEVECPTPYEIIPQHLLQRPTVEQLSRIKTTLQTYNTFQAVPLTTLYETDSDTFKALIPEHFRYWVVTFKDIGIEWMDLEIACLLLRDSLHVDMVFTAPQANMGPGFQWAPGSIYQYYVHAFEPPPLRILTAKELGEIADTHKLLKSAQNELQNVYRSATLFRSLGELSEYSDMKVIGYFAVIESLLTHDPKLPDLMDSLTHQIKTKMQLLRKRFDRQVDYLGVFKTDNADRVWSKLYAFRSKIVHGGKIDFGGELKLLKDKNTATHFLREAAKLLVLAGLREPELITDLQHC